MILADTNIIIDYLKNTVSVYDAIIEKEEIATCGIIFAELLHGARSQSDVDNISAAIKNFHWIEIKDEIWEIVGNNLKNLRNHGVTLPFQDAILATVCILNNLTILSKDKHFDHIKKWLPDLKLYQ
jgi:predicted nucleic acid-binding protein